MCPRYLLTPLPHIHPPSLPLLSLPCPSIDSRRLGTAIVVRGVVCDSVESFEGMKAAIPRLRKKLGADSEYFRRVYLYTFDFGRAEGQRSLPIEIALAFWGLLLPIGLKGGACSADDSIMKVDGGSGSGGWTEEHSQLWYDFLGEKKNIKGISKDTWAMVGVFPPFPLPLLSLDADRLKFGICYMCARVVCCSSLRSCARRMQSSRRTTWKVRSPILLDPCERSDRLLRAHVTNPHPLPPCSRMAIDDRRFRRVGS